MMLEVVLGVMDMEVVADEKDGKKVVKQSKRADHANMLHYYEKRLRIAVLFSHSAVGQTALSLFSISYLRKSHSQAGSTTVRMICVMDSIPWVRCASGNVQICQQAFGLQSLAFGVSFVLWKDYESPETSLPLLKGIRQGCGEGKSPLKIRSYRET